MTYKFEQNGKRVRMEKPICGTWTVFIDGVRVAYGIKLERDALRFVKQATKSCGIVLILALMSLSSRAAEPSPSPASNFDPTLLGGKPPVLTEQEKAGVAITNAWRDKSLETLVGQPGENSSVKFRFGESLPTIVCAILQVTDIELEPGEAVTHINLGDATRWSVESAVSGSGETQVEHLIVKPRDVGLSTSLVVTTDRRTYHLLLVSDAADFMHWVTFLYKETQKRESAPTEAPSVVAPPREQPSEPPLARTSKPAKKQVAFVAKVQADPADDSYQISGRPEWKPVNVYSKDGKTYIEMPSSVRHKEAPVLFEEKKSGWFHHSKDLVNYRVHGKWYVVDRVLDSAVLVSGVGATQEKVEIRHVDKPPTKVVARDEQK
jgi:type IV secretion system protein TrbG